MNERITPSPVSRRPLVDQVIAVLTEMIEDEGLSEGDRIPSEAELASNFGVGRSTIREAIRGLAHAGVLVTRQGSGTYVGAADARGLEARLATARVDEVFEAREGIEKIVAELAPLRRSNEHLAMMHEALEACRDCLTSGDMRGFIVFDEEFHLVAAKATGNTVLVELYSALQQSLDDVSKSIIDLVDLGSALETHQALLEAIAEKRPDAAVKATQEYLADIHKSAREP